MGANVKNVHLLEVIYRILLSEASRMVDDLLEISRQAVCRVNSRFIGSPRWLHRLGGLRAPWDVQQELPTGSGANWPLLIRHCFFEFVDSSGQPIGGPASIGWFRVCYALRWTGCASSAACIDSCTRFQKGFCSTWTSMSTSFSCVTTYSMRVTTDMTT